MSTAGLVLAAGAGTRFGAPKAPVVINGERLVDHAVRCLRSAGCGPVIVVLGAWVGDVPGAEVVVNERWADGLGSSLRTGLDALEPRSEVADALITLVDLPGLTPEAVRRVLAASGGIVAATYAGRRGHPVRLARRHWNDAAVAASGDQGARAFLDDRSDIVAIEVGDIAGGDDLDTAIDGATTPTSAPPR